MKNILVPTDFSACSAEAYPHVLRFAELIGKDTAHITLLNVVVLPIVMGSDPVVYVAHDNDSWLKEATRVANEQLSKIRDKVFREISVSTVVSNSADSVQDQITQVAAEHKSDLIIMGTHGRSGLNKFLLGSIADKVIRIAPCPVLLVPPKDREVK